MSWAKYFISRYALTASLSLITIIFGAISYSRIGIDRHPDVELPALSISTSLPGMSSQSIAVSVTQVLESKLNTIVGIDTLASSSVTGLSVITMTFQSGTNMAEALNEVEGRISQAKSELPFDAKHSVVQRFAINSTPVLWMTLSADKPKQELATLARVVQKRIEPIRGVGEVQLRGITQRILQITVDDNKLDALNLTYSDIENAFRKNHINGSGGRLKTAGKEYQLDMAFEYTNPSELSKLFIAEKGNRIIRLGEIATIEESVSETRDLARYNGKTTVALGIVKASGTNPVELINTIKAKVNHELKEALPAGVTLSIVSDEAKPIENIITVLKSHLIEGTLLTAIVVWLFLQSVRATTIIATAIPISLLGAIAALYIFGFTFNSFTLLALLLLIGIVVDDAIVVLENIYRLKEEQPELSDHACAAKATSEVMFAVMAATLTLVCMFGPVVFLPGVLGQYLASFSVTVVIGVLISWFVSMTLTPMLCARYLRVERHSSTFRNHLQAHLKNLEKRYQAILEACLSRPKIVLFAALATLIPSWFLLTTLKIEFSPQIDEGRISIQLSLPSGHGKEKIKEIALLAESQLKTYTDIAGVLTTFEDGTRNGNDNLNLLILLKDVRKVSQNELIDRLQKHFSSIPGWRASIQPATGIGGSKANGSPLHFYLLGSNYDSLQNLAQQIQLQLTKLDGLQHLNTSLNNGLPQIAATINTDEAAHLGVSAQEISYAINALNGHLSIGRYTADNGERHDVVLRSERGINPADTDVINRVKVRTRSGELIPMSAVVQFQVQGAPVSLQRVNQQYAITFYGHPRMALGDAVAVVDQIRKELPAGYSILFSGQAEEMRKARSSFAIVMLLSIALLYLVLASQFNNFIQPLLVMLALPLAVIGGISGLAITGQTVNIYSMIGLLLLVGLVAKNSILLVDRTNQLLASGIPINMALIVACPERLRPVLMTSLTVILALLPAALGLGAGAEYNQPMSIAVIGGMISSTVLTLLVVPVAHFLLERGKQKMFISPGQFMYASDTPMLNKNPDLLVTTEQ